MRSYVLPLAALAATVMAVPAPDADCVTKGNTVITYKDVTVTSLVYVTEGVPLPTYAPAVTTKRKKHSHKPKPTTTTSAYYAPAPAPEESYYMTTITYGYEQPAQSEAPAPPAHTEVQNSPAPQQKPSDTGNLAADVVAIHNYYRAKYGVDNVQWSDTLAGYAQGHTGSCQMVHTGGPYGENLAQGYQSAVSAVEGWYGEYNQYNYGDATFSMNTGHFTQVIWKGTQEVGCHLADCNGNPLLMCEYNPPGNMLGSFDSNVPQMLPGYSPN